MVARSVENYLDDFPFEALACFAAFLVGPLLLRRPRFAASPLPETSEIVALVPLRC